MGACCRSNRIQMPLGSAGGGVGRFGGFVQGHQGFESTGWHRERFGRPARVQLLELIR